jgi:hypothetical protein
MGEQRDDPGKDQREAAQEPQVTVSGEDVDWAGGTALTKELETYRRELANLFDRKGSMFSSRMITWSAPGNRSLRHRERDIGGMGFSCFSSRRFGVTNSRCTCHGAWPTDARTDHAGQMEGSREGPSEVCSFQDLQGSEQDG